MRRGLAGVTLVLLAACTPTAESTPSAEPTPSPTGSPAVQPATPEPTSPAASVPSTAEATVLGPGIISTDDEEYRISFTPDGQTAYFGRGTDFFPQSQEATILETTLTDGEWSEPSVAAFSGEYPDIDPWVSPDGESIYFSSIRPIDGEERRDAELFRVDREEDGWSEPIHLASLGSPQEELGASVAEDGSIWFASDRPGGPGGWELYTASPSGDGFGEPELIADLNTSAWEYNPAIDATGTTLIFTGLNRPGGAGLGDLFVTERAGDSWSEPRPLASNTTADEYHASLSPDRSTLYFVRRDGHGDLYEIPLSEADPAE